MHRWVLVLLLLAGCDDTRLTRAPNPQCNMPCHPDPKYAGIGECRHGTWDCGLDITTDNPTCVGWKAPSDEVCDGLDNNCNGIVDNIVEQCKTACDTGTRTCIASTWTECSAKQPTQEVCDGLDNDCDGIVDNPDRLPIEMCYTLGLDHKTLRHGICAPGIYTCLAAQKVCTKDRMPEQEVCDGLDNDCDGITDNNTTGQPSSFDIIVVFDTSGSMGYTISKVANASSTWSSKYGADQRYRFAVVTAPNDNMTMDIVLRQDLTDPATFTSVVKTLTATGSGLEPTIDVLWILLDQTNPLNITWRSGAKRAIIMFTDEHPQSYESPNITTSDLAWRVNSSGVQIAIFTSTSWISSWGSCVPTPNGRIIDINMSDADMVAELDKIIATIACN